MSAIEPGIGNDAVRTKTGKDWGEWFAILDAAGAQQMDHKAIVAYLVENHQVGPWWQQSITVAYEQARGLRDKHQMPDGYQVSRSKTLPAEPERVFAAWKNEEMRSRWLPDPQFTIRTEKPHKTMRFTWVDGRTSVDVSFYEKGNSKTQVTVQHNKLKDAAEADAMKLYWAEALKRLEAFLVEL